MVGLGDIVGSINFGIFGAGTTEIDAISGIVDLYPEENHSLKVTKTKYPVEDGSSRTDNFVVEPKQLVLKGLVSDLQPLLGGLVTIPNDSRPKEAWGRIEELHNSGDLVSVVTIMAMYENMMVTAVDASVSRGTGKSLFFTITLDEVLIAETQTVDISDANVSGPAETKASDAAGGQKQAGEPEDTTLLQDIVSGVGGFFF